MARPKTKGSKRPAGRPKGKNPKSLRSRAAALGVNHRTFGRYVNEGIEPADPEIRHKLKLPKLITIPMSIPSHLTADTTLTRAVLRILRQHVGEENAIRRGALVQLVRNALPQARKVSLTTLDRQVRDALARLSVSDGPGALVCSARDGSGYFLAGSQAEMDEHLAKERARLLSIAGRIAAQRRSAEIVFAELDGRPVEQLELI